MSQTTKKKKYNLLSGKYTIFGNKAFLFREPDECNMEVE